ncbi:MAG: squalene--hopene cyclase [Cyanobacteria bacterium RI_101]|nr:squalene--hopene cyclase [Cyanobacteria bacterium RI_101]
MPTSLDAQALAQALSAGQSYLLAQQDPEGYWQGELESNVTLTAEVAVLQKIWGVERPWDKAVAYLRRQQRDHGGWELYYGDGGDLSASIEAYMALRVLGVPPDDPGLLRAKDFILQRGGITRSRIFTKIHLALIGCYDWRGTPSIPPWVMLLPDWSPFNIYELSSWARSSTVPLIIVCDRKPVYDLGVRLDELYREGQANVRYELPRQGDWTDWFVELDQIFKWQESNQWVPFRQEGLRAAEKWILERQEVTGDWGGIIPAMLNSMLALKVLDYPLGDPFAQRGWAALDRFALETEETYYVQACVSPVWDTAWVIRALAESGLDPAHPALVKAGEWLLSKQILRYGDWQVKNKQGRPGGWAFEFENNFYPDLDDTAVVVMALAKLRLPDPAAKQGAIFRALDWIVGMQCENGGWAAFDRDNNQAWLNDLPYGDLKAMIDPASADVTARVLEMVGACGLPLAPGRLERALAYLLGEQEADGSWFGRWGVNYLYGTSGALSALALVGPQAYGPQIERALQWLLRCQNPDGGWGETCASYRDPSLKGRGISTVSQTAWALIGLLDGAKALDQLEQAPIREALERGALYLIHSQNADGAWDEAEFTGTGFPNHFYIHYHLYCQYFPLLALGRIQAAG